MHATPEHSCVGEQSCANCTQTTIPASLLSTQYKCFGIYLARYAHQTFNTHATTGEKMLNLGLYCWYQNTCQRRKNSKPQVRSSSACSAASDYFSVYGYMLHSCQWNSKTMAMPQDAERNCR